MPYHPLWRVSAMLANRKLTIRSQLAGTYTFFLRIRFGALYICIYVKCVCKLNNHIHMYAVLYTFTLSKQARRAGAFPHHAHILRARLKCRRGAESRTAICRANRCRRGCPVRTPHKDRRKEECWKGRRRRARCCSVGCFWTHICVPQVRQSDSTRMTSVENVHAIICGETCTDARQRQNVEGALVDTQSCAHLDSPDAFHTNSIREISR